MRKNFLYAYTVLRVLQILTLIPIWATFAYLVNLYPFSSYDLEPPASTLTFLIIALLTTVWTVATFCYFRSRSYAPMYYSFIDLVFFGVLLAGIIILTRETNAYCAWGAPEAGDDPRRCMVFKAAWVLGILNLNLFLWSAMVSLMVSKVRETIPG